MPSEAMNDDPDESFVIETILRHSPGAQAPAPPSGTLGLYQAGDDAARTSDRQVVTVDAMVEGIHFRSTADPADVGWKLVAVNASDIGAMGCRPDWAVLAVSLPAPINRRWIEGFACGLGEALAFWDIRLIGGDTTASTGPITLSLTLTGSGTRIISRAGAHPEERIWVTGTLGDAAAGFTDPDCVGAQTLARPTPPVRFGGALAGVPGISAMMDISDGLARDLGRLCRASNVSARVEPQRLPIGPSLRDAPDPVPAQVAFGEDYQLLFTAQEDATARIQELAREHGIQVTDIGHTTQPVGAPVATLAGREWPIAMWSHFQEQSA